MGLAGSDNFSVKVSADGAAWISAVEITGATDKIDSFVDLMREIGLVEVGRTGVVGMVRGQTQA